MARITVENCLEKIDSRFLLCLLVTQRAQAILSGGESMLKGDNREIVTALREIEKQLVDVTVLQDAVIEKQRSSNSGNDYFLQTHQFAKSDSAIDEMMIQEIDKDEMSALSNNKKGSIEFSPDMFADENEEVVD